MILILNMKKSSLFQIVLIILVILLIATIFYKISQVQSFKKDLRPTTELEKQKIIEILSAEINTTGYEISFGNVLTKGDKTFVQVQLKKDNIKKSYLINLNNESLVRNYNEH